MRVFMKILRYSLFSVLGGGVLVSGYTAIYAYRATLPIHQIEPDCYSSRVTFNGPKPDRFIYIMERAVEWREEPYIVRNNQVFTTIKGLPYDRMTASVMSMISPGWSIGEPRPISPEAERLIDTWKKKEASGDVAQKEWCHVVEAAVARDGVDIEARQRHPDIWPLD